MSSSNLSFVIPGLRGAAVPVQVYGRNSADPRNVLSNATIGDLVPGHYTVTARLPNGRKLSAEVEVPDGGSVEAVLAADYTGDPARDVSTEEIVASALGGNAAFPEDNSQTRADLRGYPSGNAVQRSAKKSARRGGSSDGRESLSGVEIEAAAAANDSTPARSRVRVLTGNVLKGELAEAKQPPPGNSPGKWTIQGAPLPQFVEVAAATGVNAYVALPAGGHVGCEVEVTLDPVVDIRVRMQHPEADVLLRYEDAGLRKQSQILAEQVWTADRLMLDKFEDPIAAAVGGYTLLRCGETGQLGDWAHRLAEMFDWLPDGLVIYAEYLAQEGRHEEALQYLLKVEHRGLPLFSYGLSRVLGRLRLYGNETENVSGGDKLQPGNPEALRLALKLQPYASACEFRNPLTNFMGQSPSKPGL